MWVPTSTNMILSIVIVWILFVVFDVILLIRSFCKFKNFVQKHKNHKKWKQNLEQKHASKESLRGNDKIRQSVDGDTSCHSKFNAASGKDEVFTTTSHVNHEVRMKRITLCSSNEKFSSKADKNETEAHQNSVRDVVDDVKHEVLLKTTPRQADEPIYETVTFSNVFLLVRLRNNLLFLSLILLLFCLGFGSTIVVTVMLYFNCTDSLIEIDTLLFLVTPAIICPGLNALILCFTTSDLKLALLSSISKLLYICRSVHYVKK